MARDRGPGEIQTVGLCLLCDATPRPPVAICRRCGSFVCHKHVVKLVHRLPQRPIGLMAPRPVEEINHREMVCEVCYLNGIASRGEAV